MPRSTSSCLRNAATSLFLMVMISGVSALRAQDAAERERLDFFEKMVRPVLVDRCYKCHSGSPDTAKGGLVVDTAKGLLQGGDSGPSIVPGDADGSLLIEAIEHKGDITMPPKSRLSDAEIAALRLWVEMGAVDPRDGSEPAPKSAIDLDAGRKFWSFVPPQSPTPPAPRQEGWAKGPVDLFVLAAMEGRGLAPVKDATREDLIRRLTFDLIGLPPSPDEVAEFVADRSPDATERAVDRLLSSPHFGEKWGRHWLDVARYAESSGKEQNVIYPDAWRYRDYVIASFNADKPYDRFLVEQIAGDLLPHQSDAERAEHLVATGYLAIGPKSHNTRDPYQFQVDVADEQIDALTQGVLGITVACARCHDHKFDPIPTRDYHAMLGIFMSTETAMGTPSVGRRRSGAPLIELPNAEGVARVKSHSDRELTLLRGRLENLVKERDALIAEARSKRTRPNQVAGNFVRLQTQISTIEQQLSHYQADGSPKALAMGMRERARPQNAPIFVRGELDNRGEVVPRGFIQVLDGAGMTPVKKGSGRLELADAIASAANPLTARVMVNRIWRHLFGRGIVESTENFGTTGTPPSHPELLDWLACRFVENGWSIKSIVKELVLTRTYQLASDNDSKAAAVDPDGVYYWRHAPRRLDAEEIRDAMIVASGFFDPKPPVGSPISRLEGNAAALQRPRLAARAEIDQDVRHRSVYLPVIRDLVPEALAVFDFAEPSLIVGDRDATNVPSQALYLMNDGLVLRLAEAMAERIIREVDKNPLRIERAFRLAFGRKPEESEKSAAADFFRKFPKAQGVERGNAGRQAMTAFCQSLFAAAEFRYID